MSEFQRMELYAVTEQGLNWPAAIFLLALVVFIAWMA